MGSAHAQEAPKHKMHCFAGAKTLEADHTKHDVLTPSGRWWSVCTVHGDTHLQLTQALPRAVHVRMR